TVWEADWVVVGVGVEADCRLPPLIAQVLPTAIMAVTTMAMTRAIHPGPFAVRRDVPTGEGAAPDDCGNWV
ncbi:MAG: hypothetical protein L0H81_05680, partial [Actinomyces sp.]|nr:hypothetical protein [Actinomyces sp.]